MALFHLGHYFYTNSPPRPGYWLGFGDTAWSITRLTLPDVLVYLDDRQAKGFNVIIMEAIEVDYPFSTDARADGNGNFPFVTQGVWTARNTAYWTFVKQIVDAAAARGIRVWMWPAYTGFAGASPAQGFASVMSAQTNADMTDYGEFLGTFFQSCGNLEFVNSGDQNGTGLQDRIAAVAQGIINIDPTKIQSVHCAPEAVPVTVFSSWPVVLDFSNVYTYEEDPGTPYAYEAVVADYARSPTRVTGLLESGYENRPGITLATLRHEAWWPLTSGGQFAFFGNEATWPFTTGWEATLNSAGAVQAALIPPFFAPLNWWDAHPDSSHTFVTAGYGTSGDADFATFMACDHLLYGYVPTNRASVTVNMSLFTTPMRVRWFNPATGAYTSQGVLANSGSQAISMPGTGDMVLLLEPQGANMGQTWTRLAGPALVTNTAATKYTVPASTKTKIQNIHVQNPGGGSAVTFTCSIGADAAGTRIADAVSIPAGGFLDLYGPYYLAATEIIQAFAGTTNVLTLTIDGIESTA